MKEQRSSVAEVSLNPHSDLPASGVISTEIKPAAVAVPERAETPRAVPFGVYFGKDVPEPTAEDVATAGTADGSN